MPKARNWRDVRADAIKAGKLTEAGLAAASAQIEAQERAYRLAQVRESQATRQTELAERMHVDQSRVSRIENGDLDHTELGTIRSYVEALGGRLEVRAEFEDQSLTIA